MDKLTDEEQMRSGMMLETVTEVFLGMVMPAFKLVRGEMGDQPREKQCEAFHDKVREMTKGKLETTLGPCVESIPWEKLFSDTVYIY